MESEIESHGKEFTVRELQAALFPPISTNLKSSSSFFANFLIKPNVYDEDTDDTSKRDSRELFLLNRESNFVPQPPRWPTECQVLETTIKHIDYVPPVPEAYYTPTGKEVQPKPTGDDCGIIVYQYTPISVVNYFSRSSVGGSRYLLPACICPEEDSLRFESRFESGNLARAIRITPNYYELHLRADLYTNRHMQWFYFKITNMRKKFLYRFSIVNFSKEDSLYNEGMQPLMYSTKDSHLHSIGWRRCGENITYYSNDNVSPEDPEGHMSYTLSFTMEFPHADDDVFLAHCYPYTYSDLEDYLTELSNHPIKAEFTTVRLLCKSLAGNNVHYVTITSPPGSSGDIKRKRSVVLTARVHPGETPASWMMKGFMDFLTSDCSVAKELRDKFIFKLVPMLNPDGVIVGNNRCSLSAKDLNRQYRTVMRDAYPSIWYTKLMVRRLLEECGVAMYCDLHAHSRKHNIFIYGCENRRGGDRKLQEQVFPLMLHKNTADKFSFESCKFRIQKNKEGTGRVVMWMMGISNSYTMEASFAGSMIGTRNETHFSTMDFELMGKSFCQTLLDFYDDDPRKEKLRLKIINRLVKEGSNADEPTNIRLSDYSSSDEGDTSSSSSNEVGRDDDEVFLPIVPPPSPIVYKKSKQKVYHHHKKSKKSPNLARKPLPMCRTTLGLTTMRDKETQKYNSESSSCDSEPNLPVAKNKNVRRKCKKKRTKKKVDEYNERDMTSISVLELLPSEKLCMQAIAKRSKTPQPRIDKKNEILQQLAEVQAKLFSLKSKLWFGCNENGLEPLSWGRSQINLPEMLPAAPKSSKKIKKNASAKQYLVPTKLKDAPAKLKDASKKKNQNGLRRQTAVDLLSRGETKIKKSKSLPDTKSALLKARPVFSCDEEEKTDLGKKKKKKRTKFGKKAKTVANAKMFLKD